MALARPLLSVPPNSNARARPTLLPNDRLVGPRRLVNAGCGQWLVLAPRCGPWLAAAIECFKNEEITIPPWSDRGSQDIPAPLHLQNRMGSDHCAHAPHSELETPVAHGMGTMYPEQARIHHSTPETK
ncbi:hypothetical protein NDU88_002687 [Pleurodeles waltl]|uniref:Uncharacterized protein n=1 Tax=Pleurodeles waltl TaxID=8319 RepID=A0AAV7M372_PLEWA|nr:hypothetical protein NDU88_002687 [Pleurodeles waltl]